MSTTAPLPTGAVTMSFAEGIRRDIIRRIQGGEGFDNKVCTIPIKRRNALRPHAFSVIGWTLLHDEFVLLARTYEGKTSKRAGDYFPLIRLTSHAVARAFSRLNTNDLNRLLEEFRPLALDRCHLVTKGSPPAFEHRTIDNDLIIPTPNGLAFAGITCLGKCLPVTDGYILTQNNFIFVKTWCSFARLQDGPGHLGRVYAYAQDLGKV